VNFLPSEYDIIKQNSPRAQRTLLFSSLDIAEDSSDFTGWIC